MGGSAYTFSEEYSDFWEYNPGTNSWSKKTIFDKRDHPIAFSINGKGYVGMGSNSDGAKNDFWEYNTTTDTWNAKNNFSGGNIYYPVSFTIGNKGYMIIHDATYEGDVFWEYDPEKDIWTAKANCSIYGMCHAGFSVGNKGYFMLNNALYEYTP
jgi:N-acetylneuraminic acid mutarotase